MSLTGKVVLVTKASSGMGAAIAIDLSSRGALVVITDFHNDDLNKVAKECKGPEPLVIVKDVLQRIDIEHIIYRIIEKYGKLDVLINNFGIDGCDWIETLPREETKLFDSMLSTNSRIVCEMTMLSVPFLKKMRGNIINVTGVCNLSATNEDSVGCRVKIEVDRVTLQMAEDNKKDGIRVNAVFLNRIPTGFLRSNGFSETDIQRILKAAEKQRKEAMQTVTERVSFYIEREGFSGIRDLVTEENGIPILQGAPGQ